MGSNRLQTEKRPPIPGERPASPPTPEVSARLLNFRPYVRQTGDDWRKPWFLPMRKLLDYLAVYIAEGTGRFTVADSTFDVGKGDFIWVPPDTPHEMRGHAPVMHCIFAHFDLVYDPARCHWDAYIPGNIMDLSGVGRLMHPPIDDPVISAWCGKLPVGNPADIRSLLERVHVEHIRAPAGSALLLSGLLLQLVDAVDRGLASNAGVLPAHYNEMRKAALTIQEQYDGNADVARLAKRASLSASHFRKVFRAAMGRNARRMHREARIRKACAMLMYQSMSVSEVALALGYSTVQNFSRAFRQMTGLSPRNYRRSGAEQP
jgi:AraC-like DNA-binding protein